MSHAARNEDPPFWLWWACMVMPIAVVTTRVSSVIAWLNAQPSATQRTVVLAVGTGLTLLGAMSRPALAWIWHWRTRREALRVTRVAKWQVLQARFDRMTGEVNATRMAYRSSARREWALDGEPLPVREFRGLALIASEARGTRNHADDNASVEAWLDAAIAAVQPVMTAIGSGQDEHGQYDTALFQNMSQVSSVACGLFAASVH